MITIPNLIQCNIYFFNINSLIRLMNEIIQLKNKNNKHFL